MKWNHSNNRPLGKIRDLTISPEDFKLKVEEWLEESKDDGFFDRGSDEIQYSDELEQNIKDSLECVKYDLHQYMLTHAYSVIKDPRLRDYFIFYHGLSHSPSKEIIEFDMNFYPETGVNILTKSDDMRWGGVKTVSNSDIYCRLYFCESEYDIWDIFADGVGDIRSLYDYYQMHDSTKALSAMLYVYNKEENIMGNCFETCPKSVKEEIESILINQYFDGMYDNFFDEKNIERVQEAWNTEILEVRKEFLQSDHSLKMLKRILNSIEF